MNKKIYIDIETTGLDPKKCAITQLSAIVEIDGEIISYFNEFIKPFDGASITNEALLTTGQTMDDLNKFQHPAEGYRKFIDFLDHYIDKYDKEDKFTVVGYNVKFDMDFIEEMFVRNNNKYAYSYFNGMKMDVFAILPFLKEMGVVPKLKNNKLSSWCEHFGIELKAHDSMEDIKATRELFYKLKKKWGDVNVREDYKNVIEKACQV